MEEELGQIYNQLLETGFIDDNVTPEMFKSKIGSPEAQKAVRDNLLSSNFIDESVTLEMFGSKISEWSGSTQPQSAPQSAPQNAPEEQYDIIPMNDDGTDAIPENAVPLGTIPLGTVEEVEAAENKQNAQASVERDVRSENGLSEDTPVSVTEVGRDEMNPTQLVVDSHNKFAELYDNSADYSEFEDDTSTLSTVTNFLGDAVDGLGYWLSAGSNEMSTEVAEKVANRNADTKALRAKAVGEIDSKLPDDLPVLNLEAATDIVVSEQEADENIKTTRVTAEYVSQALKKNSDRLNEVSSFRISKLTDKEQEIFSNLSNIENEGEQLKGLLANPEFVQKGSKELVRAVKGRIAALDQGVEINKEVDKYSGLLLNISSVVKDAKESKNDDGTDFTDDQIRDQINLFLDSDAARERFSGEILDATKRSVADSPVYTNMITRGFANLGSVVEGGAGAVKDYISNALGFGDKYNETIDIKAELGKESLDNLSEGIERALQIEGGELQEAAIFTDVIESDGILYEIQKDGKGNDIVVGKRDSETKKKLKLLQPYAVEGSGLNIDDLRKDFNLTGLVNQGWRTFVEMIPMVGGGMIGGATKIDKLGKLNKLNQYIGTATGTTLTMFKRGMEGYLEGGASYEDAGAAALLESFLVAGLESVVGIEKSVIAKFSGETKDVVKTITTDAMKKGLVSASKPADAAKLLSNVTRKLAVKSGGVIKEVKGEVLEEMVFERLINMAMLESLGLDQEEFTVNGALTELALTMAVSGPLGVFTSKGDTRDAGMIDFAKQNKEETLSIFDQLISEASTEEEIQGLEGSKAVFVNTIERESFLTEATLDKDDKGALSGLSDKISELEMQANSASTERGRENAKAKAAELTEYLDEVGKVAQTGNPIDVKKGSLVRHDGKVYKVGDINSEEGYTLTPLTSDKQIKTKTLNDVPAKKAEKKSSPTQSAETAVVTPTTGDQGIATDKTGKGSEVTPDGEAGVTPSELTPEQIEEVRVKKEATVKQVASKQKEVDTINETVKTQETTINNSFKPDNSVEIVEKKEVGDTVDVDGSDYQLFEDGEYYQVTTAKGNPVKGGKGRKLSKAKKANIEAKQAISEQGAGVQARLDNGDTPLQILNDISKTKDGQPLVVEDLPPTIANRETIIENYNSRKEGLSSRNSLQDDITNLNKGNEQVQGNTGGVQSNGGVDGNAPQQVAESEPIVQGSVRSNRNSTQQEVKTEKTINEGDVSSIKLSSGSDVPVIFSDGQWRKQKKDGKPYAKALPQARQDQLNAEVSSGDVSRQSKIDEINKRREEELGSKVQKSYTDDNGDSVTVTISESSVNKNKEVVVIKSNKKGEEIGRSNSSYPKELNNEEIYEAENGEGYNYSQETVVESIGGKKTDKINAKYDNEIAALGPEVAQDSEVKTEAADVFARGLEKLGTTRSKVKSQIIDSFTNEDMSVEEREQLAEANMIALEAIASTMSELDAVEYMAQHISSITTLSVEQVKDLGSAQFSKSSDTKNAIVNSESVPVKETKELSAEVMEGTSSIGRLTKEEEAGTIVGGERAVQATIIASRSEGKDTRDPNRKQREELAEWAEQEGILFEEEDPAVFGKYMGKGDEQNVYRKPGDPNTVVKSNDLSMHDTPAEFFDRLAIHNMLFPEAAYTVIGVSKRNGKFSIVIEQPAIEGTKPTSAEIDSDMKAKGYTKSNNKGTYYNSDHVLDDVTPSNVKKLESGELSYFDAALGLNTQEDEFGGDREPNAINSGLESSGVVQYSIEQDSDQPGGVTLKEAVDRNNGNPMSKTADGKKSKLYEAILKLPKINGNKKKADKFKAQVYSDNFKGWFGDWQGKDKEVSNVSKVVDENGEPLLVYHSSANSFDTFENDVAGGFYFADNVVDSKIYALGSKSVSNVNTEAVFLNIKDPYKSKFMNKVPIDLPIGETIGEMPNQDGTFLGEAPAGKKRKDFISNLDQDGLILEGDWYEVTGGSSLTEKLTNREVLESSLYKGKEGDINKNLKGLDEKVEYDVRSEKVDGELSDLVDDALSPQVKGEDFTYAHLSSTQYVATDPNQIKSVFNEGQFSSDTGNIRFSKESAQTAKSVVDGGSVYDDVEYVAEAMVNLGSAEANYTTPEVSGSLEGNAYEESNSSVGMTDEQAQLLEDPETKSPYKSAKDFLSKFIKDISFFNGIPTIPAMSDNLAAGTIKDGAGNDMELNGGLLFNVIGSLNNTKLGWAGVNQAGAQAQLDEAIKLYEDNKVLFDKLWAEGKLPQGHVPMAVLRMADTAIDSNEAVFRFLSPFLKTLPLKNRKAALESLKDSLKSKAEGASKTAWYSDLDTNIANGTLSTVEDVVEYVDNVIANSDNIGQTTEATKFKNKIGKKKKGQPRTIEDVKEDVSTKMENLTSAKILKIINDNKVTTLDGLFDLIVKGAKERTDGAENNEFSLPIRSFINDSILGGAETSTMASTKALYEGLPKDKRVEVAKTMTKGFVLSQIGEPFMNKAEKGDVMSVVGIDVREATRGVKRADHNNYGWGPVGRPIALIGKPKNGVDVFPEWEAKATRVFKKAAGAKGKFPDAENVANQTGGAFYVDKAFRGSLINTVKDSLSVLVGKLRFAFPSVNVALSDAEFNNIINRPDVRKRVADGDTIYGVTVDGKVFLNPNKRSLNTPIHEFGHIWTDYLRSKASGKKGTALLDRGMELVKGTKAHKAAIKKYGDTPIALEEALVTLIANRGETLIAAAKKNFKNWLNGVFKFVQSNFVTSEKVFKKSSGIDVSNVSLDEFINIGLADLFKGKDVNAKFDATSVETSTRARLSTDGTTVEASTRIMDNIVTRLERINESAKIALKNETNKERKSEIRAEIKQNSAIIKETKAAVKDKKFSKDGTVYRGAAVALSNGKHIIAALGNTIPTTFQHEIFHALIEPALMNDPKAKKALIEEYNEVFGDNATEFNEDVSEYAARVYETYLSNGRKIKKSEVKDGLKRATLQKMFDTFTNTMKEFYGKVLEYNNSKGITKPIAVSEQSQEFFDRVLGIKNESKIKENESNEKDGKKGNESKTKEKESSSSEKRTKSEKEQVLDKGNFGFEKAADIPKRSRALYNQFLQRVLDKGSQVSDDVKAVIRNIAKPPVRISDDQLREMAAIALDGIDPTNAAQLNDMLETLKESFDLRQGTEAPFEVVAIMELIRLASEYGHDATVAKANVALGEIFSDAGRTLRLARADVLAQYQHIVLVSDLMEKQSYKMNFSLDGKRTVKERIDQSRKDVNTILEETQDQRIEMAMDAYNAKQNSATSNESTVEVEDSNSAAAVVNNGSRKDLKSAAKFKAKAAKARAEAAILFKKSRGQFNSGINANLIQFAAKHVEALIYESAGSLVLAKKKLKKIFKDSKIVLTDAEFSKLFDLAVLSDEVKQARAEVLKTKLIEKIKEQGKKQTPNTKDPFAKLAQSLLAQARKQGGLNNNGTPVRNQKEAVEVILQQLEDNKFQLNTIKDAINDVTLLSTVTSQERAQLKVELENLMSKITGTAIGKTEMRRAMRADAKKQGKTIARIIREGETKNGIFKEDLITRLIVEAGLTGQQAADVQAELEKSFDAIVDAEEFSNAIRASFKDNADLDEQGMKDRLAGLEKKLKDLSDELAVARKASNAGKGRSLDQIKGDIERTKKEKKIVNKKLKEVGKTAADFLSKPRFQQSEKNLIAAAKSGQLNDQHIQALFEEAFGIMSLTPEDIREIETLAAQYGTSLTNASKERNAEQIAKFFERKRILDPSWAEMVGAFSYTNMLSGITTPQTALLATAGIAAVQQGFEVIIFDIIPGLAKLDSGALRTVINAFGDAFKYSITVGVPEAAKVMWTGKSTANILDSDGEVSFAQRSKVEAAYFRFLKKKHKGLGWKLAASIAKAVSLITFGVPLVMGVRALYAVDPLVTPGLVRFISRREALTAAKRFEGKNGKKLRGSELLGHVNGLIGSTEATNDFIAQEKAELDAIYQAKLDQVKGSSPAAGLRRASIKTRRASAKRLAEYTIRKQFTNGEIGQAATDYVREVALMNETEGLVGALTNPINAWINTKTGSQDSQLAAVLVMLLKVGTIPFLRLTGNAVNMTWRLTPLSLIANYREVLDGNNNPTGQYKMKFGRPKHKAILNSSKSSESRPLTINEQKSRVLWAVAPTMIALGIAALLFETGDCDDEKGKTCIKLKKDSNFVITGAGEGYGKDLSAGERPNTLYRRLDDGTLESVFEFKDIPVLRTMFGFVGELSDQVRRNANNGADNLEFSATNILYYMGKSAIKGVADSGILNSAESLIATVQAVVGLMSADANYRAEGKAIRDMNKLVTNTLGTMLPMNANLYKKTSELARQFFGYGTAEANVDFLTDNKFADAFIGQYAKGILSPLLSQERLDAFGRPDFSKVNLKMIPDFLERKMFKKVSEALEKRMKENPYKIINKFESYDDFKPTFLSAEVTKSSFQTTDGDEYERVISMAPKALLDKYEREADNLKYQILDDNYDDLDELNEVQLTQTLNSIQKAVKNSIKAKLVNEMLEKAGVDIDYDITLDKSEIDLSKFRQQLDKSGYVWDRYSYGPKYNGTKMIDQMILKGIRLEEDGTITTGVNYKARENKKFQKAINKNPYLYDEEALEEYLPDFNS